MQIYAKIVQFPKLSFPQFWKCQDLLYPLKLIHASWYLVLTVQVSPGKNYVKDIGTQNIACPQQACRILPAYQVHLIPPLPHPLPRCLNALPIPEQSSRIHHSMQDSPTQYSRKHLSKSPCCQRLSDITATPNACRRPSP